MSEQRQRKVRSRKSIQKGGAVTVEQARKKIHTKIVKEQEREEARERRERKRMVNLEYKLQLRAGIDARRAERVRKRELLEFQRSNPDTELPRELLEVIIDPEIRLTTHETDPCFPPITRVPRGRLKKERFWKEDPEESWEGRGSFWCWALLYLRGLLVSRATIREAAGARMSRALS
ncbi:hypothetical protein VC83_03269 [Pseudogymnoascus destructans]|uniref:Uncharacterized protein n=1 Tax=Pseudogymnoascus destructans TaxID=655981 RepID=A0A177AEZ3_9PEZI|nr:uncharacterized protein VC83_03269 [Pseudogymnoascus destructans]OAF60390.1 hypothetical protein VC83_03269 [Pseudogymnoascus destructans]